MVRNWSVSVSSNEPSASRNHGKLASGVSFSLEAPASVVIADDAPANAEYLARLLMGDGYRIHRVQNGGDALELVSRERPALWLPDVMMPDRSGFDVCATIKSDPATRLIPVVLVTALQGSDDRIRGIDAGADDFITKPANP